MIIIMKKFLFILNLINVISLFLFIPYLIYGNKLFLLVVDDTPSTLCLNQFVVSFIITFILVVYANIKKLIQHEMVLK